MNRWKKLYCVLIVLCLNVAFVGNMTVVATTVDEATDQVEDLEEQKAEAEAKQSDLQTQMDVLIAEVEETRLAIDNKYHEIEEVEKQLVDAQIEVDEQYEAMKLRIQFMYENDDANILELIFAAESMGDFLNKVEYLTEISTYDRDMLTTYQDALEVVQAHEKQLNEELQELTELQTRLETKKTELESLLVQVAGEIGTLDGEISESKEKLEELIKAAEEEARRQEEARQQAANSGGSGGSAGESVVVGNGQFAHPMPNSYISSNFGYRIHPIFGTSTMHNGTDFAAPAGTPIYAADSGTVAIAGYSSSAGNWIVINHGNGLTTTYMHCTSLFVQTGQTVSKGQNIATCGNTGYSTGAHLHFQVELNGTPVNPMGYL